ncbi:MAG: hypothetical protein ABIO14_14250 [Aeromicrobium sp.]
MGDEGDRLICENGHAISTGFQFCGTCGAPARPVPLENQIDPVRTDISATPVTSTSTSTPEVAATSKIAEFWHSHTKAILIGAAILAILFVVGLASNQGNVVHGSVTLQGGGGYTRSTPCHGTSQDSQYAQSIDNSDIDGETPIQILDASGTIVGTGTLGIGVYLSQNADTGVCQFRFDVPLDSKSSHYEIVVGQRQPFGFNDPSSVDLTLGG